MIGAFYQPRRWSSTRDTLDTLPDREFRAGLAEVIKYGLIRDRGFFEWLERNIGALRRARHGSPGVRDRSASCGTRPRSSAQDETEQRRARYRSISDIPSVMRSRPASVTGKWLHGEAVAAGMYDGERPVGAAGWLMSAPLSPGRMRRWSRRRGLPARAPAIAWYRNASRH